jgi:hypothetical protein
MHVSLYAYPVSIPSPLCPLSTFSTTTAIAHFRGYRATLDLHWWLIRVHLILVPVCIVPRIILRIPPPPRSQHSLHQHYFCDLYRVSIMQASPIPPSLACLCSSDVASCGLSFQKCLASLRIAAAAGPIVRSVQFAYV